MEHDGTLPRAGKSKLTLKELALQGWVARLFTSGSLLAEKGSEAILTAASGLIGALPDLLLFAVTAVLASFMISAQLPALRQAVLQLLPLFCDVFPCLYREYRILCCRHTAGLGKHGYRPGCSHVI